MNELDDVVINCESVHIARCSVSYLNQLLDSLQFNPKVRNLSIDFVYIPYGAVLHKLPKTIHSLRIGSCILSQDFRRLINIDTKYEHLSISIIMIWPVDKLFFETLSKLNVIDLKIGFMWPNCPDRQISSLFANPTIKKLTIDGYSLIGHITFDYILNIIGNNHTLEYLNVFRFKGDPQINLNKVLMIINHNKSIIDLRINDIDQSNDDLFSRSLQRNRILRQKRIYDESMGIIIAFSPYRIYGDLIPPYVMSEIFDWLYPYTTHLMKINLIMKMYQTIRCIKPCLNPTTLEIIEK